MLKCKCPFNLQMRRIKTLTSPHFLWGLFFMHFFKKFLNIY
nr:MAG TPA: hypothetical protein [Caudoviricetes sp.]